MPARILDACDTVVTAIGAAWNPSAPNEVKRVYAPTIGLSIDNPDTLISGRKVYVFPGNWGTPGAASRGEIFKTHTVSVLVAERYTDEAELPDSWIDERVLFVETIFDLLANPTTIHTGALVSLYRDADDPAEVDVVYDLDLLLTERKAFWSRFTITFTEIVGVAGS
jgi:hypothetical protein